MKPPTKIANGPTEIERRFRHNEVVTRALATFRDKPELVLTVKASIAAIEPKPAKPSRYKDPEKRKAYMRELMKKRRAADKAKRDKNIASPS